jgi:hypothetical protein
VTALAERARRLRELHGRVTRSCCRTRGTRQAHAGRGDARAVGRIAAAVEVPVTADLEAGYGLAPEELVAGLLEAAAAEAEEFVRG